MSITGINNGFNASGTAKNTTGGPQLASGDFASLLAGLQNQLPVTDSSSNSNVKPKDGSVAYIPPETTPSESDQAVQDFMNYMKESPAERFMDSWLAAHHITREELKNMPPEKRQAILKQIAEDMKREIETKTKEKAASAV